MLMSDQTKPAEFKPGDDNEHVLDKSLGDIHECAIALEMTGRGDWAAKLATAHGKIQDYLVEHADE